MVPRLQLSVRRLGPVRREPGLDRRLPDARSALAGARRAPAPHRSSTPLLDRLEETFRSRPGLAGRLGIEITERAPLRDYERAQQRLTTLTSLGCLLAIDDFGSGFSSFEHLRRLPVQFVKVDACFVEDVETDSVSGAILDGIINTAHALSMQIIAEAIETPDTARLLGSRAIDYGQGYLYGRPAPCLSDPPSLARPRSRLPDRLRAHHTRGSVVRPDALDQSRGKDRRMACAEHLGKELRVAFETATVGDVMSHGVISCTAETPLRVVARLMATHGVHAIFVFEPADENDGVPHLWAVVSDLDLVAATQLELDTLTAGGSAVTPLVNVAADSSIAEAGSLMAQYGIAHLAVTDPTSRRPIGVISTLDVARAVAAGHGPRETFTSA